MITLLIAGLVILVILMGAAEMAGVLVAVAWHGLKAVGQILLWVLGGCKIRLTTDLGPEREAEIREQIAAAKEARRLEKEEKRGRPSVWQECARRGRESYAQTQAKIEAQKAERIAAKAAKRPAGA